MSRVGEVAVQEDRYRLYGYESDDDLEFVTMHSGVVALEADTVHLVNRTPNDDFPDWLIGRVRTACGLRADIYGGISEFEDDRLCRRCMSALGDQTLRVFER